MQFLFWLSLALLFYIYFGYPLLAKVIAKIADREVQKSGSYEPTVSILIAAYNEANDIGATLRNKLALDYPTDKIEVLVISDESDDGTDDIVHEVAEDAAFPVRLFRQVPRQGKTSGLNTLVPEANGEIILFSDANSHWDTQALKQLCSNFADPAVGYVTGKMVYVNKDGSLVGDGCSAYMKYENWLREQETKIGSVVGVDGGIDAMRRALYKPLRADQLPDFVQPLKVVEQGYRVVYEPEALLKEEALSDGSSEFSMRVRVSLRALWALKDMKHLMNPARDPIFALQLISHKMLRYGHRHTPAGTQRWHLPARSTGVHRILGTGLAGPKERRRRAIALSGIFDTLLLHVAQSGLLQSGFCVFEGGEESDLESKKGMRF
jgi:cellulose synthase/poly-beta-1,6-N-acetylglucosamine synthase-like glycosyltransferase